MVLPQHYEFSINLISVITFLVAILIQASQNRNEKAMHAKMDELIRVSERASNSLIGIEQKVD
jgi:low affinity Fe/Cu permease